MTEIQEKTTLDTFYLVDGTNRKVTLEIFINAPGQTCTSTVKIDHLTTIERQSGSLPETLLDTNRNLANKTISIATTITNTAGRKAKASVTIHLRGGQSPAEDVLSKTSEPGDTVTYVYTCQFFNL